jgi:ACS family tartrate transporter-like MFS transporter
MIVYLTHWFRACDRSRAIACFYIAVPAASLISSPIAGWLLNVHWWQLAGWRWLFILEGVPAIVLGIITVFYLTDWPSQARWLPEDERNWLMSELEAELKAKKKTKDHSILEGFRDPRVLKLMATWFLAMCGSLSSIYWMPTLVKRIASGSDRTVTSLLLIPALVGIAGMLLNGWHSDKTAERRWHSAVPLLAAGALFGTSILLRAQAPFAIAFLLVGLGVFYAYQPVAWSIPTMILSETTAAATFGLINSVGQLGGLVGPFLIGVLNVRTHSLTAGLVFIALAYTSAGLMVLSLKVRNPRIEETR